MEGKPSQVWHTILKALRGETGLSQRQVSENSGVSRSAVRNLEDGSGNVTLQAFEKLMSYYGYELDACMITAVTEPPMTITVQSFSKKYGWVPEDALDCTKLMNPYNSLSLRKLSGLDQKVQSFVLRDADAEALIIEGVERAKRDGKVDLFCVGGRHRSVAIAEIVSRRLQLEGLTVKVKHTSPEMLDEPVLESN
jgi:transcriptional regulator with XRE-family HTH domain